MPAPDISVVDGREPQALTAGKAANLDEEDGERTHQPRELARLPRGGADTRGLFSTRARLSPFRQRVPRGVAEQSPASGSLERGRPALAQPFAGACPAHRVSEASSQRLVAGACLKLYGRRLALAAQTGWSVKGCGRENQLPVRVAWSPHSSESHCRAPKIADATAGLVQPPKAQARRWTDEPPHPLGAVASGRADLCGERQPGGA